MSRDDDGTLGVEEEEEGEDGEDGGEGEEVVDDLPGGGGVAQGDGRDDDKVCGEEGEVLEVGMDQEEEEEEAVCQSTSEATSNEVRASASAMKSAVVTARAGTRAYAAAACLGGGLD